MIKYCALLFGLMIALSACSKKEQEQQQQEQLESTSEEPASTTTQTSEEPKHIEVQHILIAFQGSIPGKNITRTQAEAQQLAMEVFALAQEGEDFDALVKQRTDDAHPGRYKMSNFGVDPAAGEYPRQGMVAAFGDVGFKLEVGGIGIASYDARTSPYGWHIIKRVQ